RGQAPTPAQRSPPLQTTHRLLARYLHSLIATRWPQRSRRRATLHTSRAPSSFALPAASPDVRPTRTLRFARSDPAWLPLLIPSTLRCLAKIKCHDAEFTCVSLPFAIFQP